jgi:hypothetical protein
MWRLRFRSLARVVAVVAFRVVVAAAILAVGVGPRLRDRVARGVVEGQQVVTARQLYSPGVVAARLGTTLLAILL